MPQNNPYGSPYNSGHDEAIRRWKAGRYKGEGPQGLNQIPAPRSRPADLPPSYVAEPGTPPAEWPKSTADPFLWTDRRPRAGMPGANTLPPRPPSGWNYAMGGTAASFTPNARFPNYTPGDPSGVDSIQLPVDPWTGGMVGTGTTNSAYPGGQSYWDIQRQMQQGNPIDQDPNRQAPPGTQQLQALQQQAQQPGPEGEQAAQILFALVNPRGPDPNNPGSFIDLTGPWNPDLNGWLPNETSTWATPESLGLDPNQWYRAEGAPVWSPDMNGWILPSFQQYTTDPQTGQRVPMTSDDPNWQTIPDFYYPQWPDGQTGPGTQPPGTQPPGTQPPGTQPPGTQPPGTQPPGTQPPGTQPPGTQPPGTQPPGTQPPGTQPPGTGLPPGTRGALPLPNYGPGVPSQLSTPSPPPLWGKPPAAQGTGTDGPMFPTASRVYWPEGERGAYTGDIPVNWLSGVPDWRDFPAPGAPSQHYPFGQGAAGMPQQQPQQPQQPTRLAGLPGITDISAVSQRPVSGAAPPVPWTGGTTPGGAKIDIPPPNDRPSQPGSWSGSPGGMQDVQPGQYGVAPGRMAQSGYNPSPTGIPPMEPTRLSATQRGGPYGGQQQPQQNASSQGTVIGGMDAQAWMPWLDQLSRGIWLDENGQYQTMDYGEGQVPLTTRMEAGTRVTANDPTMNLLLGQYQDEYVRGKFTNEARFADLMNFMAAQGNATYGQGGIWDQVLRQGQAGVGDYRNQMGQAGESFGSAVTAATDPTYGRLYQQRMNEIIAQSTGIGNQAKEDLAQRYNAAQAKLSQDMSKRGLRNTTVTGSMQRGLGAEHEADQRRLLEQQQAYQVGLMSQLSGDWLGAEERARDAATNAWNTYGQQQAKYAQDAYGIGAQQQGVMAQYADRYQGLVNNIANAMQARNDEYPSLQEIANLALQAQGMPGNIPYYQRTQNQFAPAWGGSAGSPQNPWPTYTPVPMNYGNTTYRG